MDLELEHHLQVLVGISELLKQGKPEVALRRLTPLANVEAACCETFMMLAAASADTGDFDAARTNLYKALQFEVNEWTIVHACVAIVILDFSGAKQYAEALTVYEDCERAGVVEPDMVGFKGKILFMLGRYDEALVALRRALELDPNDLLYWSTIAWIAEKTRDVTLAEEVLRRLHDIAVTGSEKIDKSELDEAIEDVEEFLNELKATGA